jgi:methionyl-tRNA synthetase
MVIKVKVPDGTKRVIVAHLLQNLLWHQEVYSKDQPQSMIVKDEPCKWCAIESEIEPSCIACEHIEEINGDGCDYCDDQSKFKPMKRYCGFCGRDLRKDVE